MKRPLKKDIYKEMRYGKKELTIVSIVVLLLSLALIGGGIAFVVLGAINPYGAWQIIWRVLVGVLLLAIGGVLLGVGITMFAVTRSMLNFDEGNVADGNRAKGTINVRKCDKCGTKLSDNATFCTKCGEKLETSNCAFCGKPLAEDTEFCEKCGKKVEKREK